MKTDAELIADHITRKGVTKCPTAALLPTTAAIAPADRERHRARGDNPAPQVWKFGHNMASKNGMKKANRQRQVEEQKRQREAAERAAAKERLREAREAAAAERKRERESRVAAQRKATLAKAVATRQARAAARAAERKSRPAAKAAPAIDPGPRPVMDWLPVDRLIVNPTYQRPLAAEAAARLAKAFRWAHFQPLTVAPAGDDWSVVDGQHRLQAARALPAITAVPCYIVDAADAAAEAGAFLAINNAHRAVAALDKFRAGVVAKDPMWLALKGIVERIGLRLVTGRSLSPMTTASVATLRECLQLQGAVALERGLAALARAWGREPEAFVEQYIRSTAQLFQAGGDGLAADTVVAVLAGLKPTEFLADQILAGKREGVSGSRMVSRELFRRCLGREFGR